MPAIRTTTIRRIAAGGGLLLAALSVASAPAASAGVPHGSVSAPKQVRLPLGAPHRVPLPNGQHITSHPNVITAVNAARQQRGWAQVTAGSNYAAEACALNYQHCNGVQWGGCGLVPLPGDQYTATVGSAESSGPRGCIEAISYSSFS